VRRQKGVRFVILHNEHDLLSPETCPLIMNKGTNSAKKFFFKATMSLNQKQNYFFFFDWIVQYRDHVFFKIGSNK